MKVVGRTGDMGQGTKLVVMRDNEGDVHLSVCPIGHRFGMDRIEFCTSGSKSPKTTTALIQLLHAMEEDERTRKDTNLDSQYEKKE